MLNQISRLKLDLSSFEAVKVELASSKQLVQQQLETLNANEVTLK